MARETMEAKAAAELLQRLAGEGEDPFETYQVALENSVIPALQALSPTELVDYLFFEHKPSPEFQHLSFICEMDLLAVVIGANENIIKRYAKHGKVEPPVTRQVRQWIGYKATGKIVPLPSLEAE